MKLRDKIPPLYQCSICGKSVKVIPQGEGVEPIKKFSCSHTNAIIWANRKVVLRGKGKLEGMSSFQKNILKIKMSVRQFLSLLLNRSL